VLTPLYLYVAGWGMGGEVSVAVTMLFRLTITNDNRYHQQVFFLV